MISTAKFRLQAAHAFLKMVRDPNRLDVVFALADGAAKSQTALKAIERTLSDPQVQKAARRRMRLPKLTVDGLLSHSQGTLGHAAGQFLAENGLDPAALPVRSQQTDAEWLSAHLYETHDLWHVITGFGPDVAGELGLQAFYSAQTDGMVPLSILSAGMLNTLFFNPESSARRMSAISRGYDLGQRAANVVGFDWASNFDRPLEEVRRSLAIQPHQVELLAA